MILEAEKPTTSQKRGSTTSCKRRVKVASGLASRSSLPTFMLAICQIASHSRQDKALRTPVWLPALTVLAKIVEVVSRQGSTY